MKAVTAEQVAIKARLHYEPRPAITLQRRTNLFVAFRRRSTVSRSAGQLTPSRRVALPHGRGVVSLHRPTVYPGRQPRRLVSRGRQFTAQLEARSSSRRHACSASVLMSCKRSQAKRYRLAAGGRDPVLVLRQAIVAEQKHQRACVKYTSAPANTPRSHTKIYITIH
jgi:hypothetical protein